MKKNIALGFIFQIVSMLCSFFIVPNAINYLGNHTYGIWITFFNMVLWIGSFDLGIGNGFRNELTRAFARKNDKYLREVISSGIVSFCVISLIAILVGLTINFILSIFYYPSIVNNNDLLYAMTILIIGYSLDIVLKTTGIIYTSKLKAAMVPFISSLTNVLSLLAVLFLVHYKVVVFNSELITYAICVGLMPVIANIAITLYALLTKLLYFFPHYKYFSRDVVKLTSKEGWQFFLIQIFMIFSLQLYNIFITTWSTPNNVTLVSVADKYFGLISVIGTVVLFPFWSRFTKADEDKEYVWIKLTVSKLERYFLLAVLASFVLLFSFDLFKKFWIGDLLQIPFIISLLVMLKYLGLVFSSIYCYYLNGIGKLKIQIIAYFFIAVLNYPISYMCFSIWSLQGILVWPVISFFIMGFVLRQVVKNDIKKKIIIKNEK